MDRTEATLVYWSLGVWLLVALVGLVSKSWAAALGAAGSIVLLGTFLWKSRPRSSTALAISIAVVAFSIAIPARLPSPLGPVGWDDLPLLIALAVGLPFVLRSFVSWTRTQRIWIGLIAGIAAWNLLSLFITDLVGLESLLQGVGRWMAWSGLAAVAVTAFRSADLRGWAASLIALVGLQEALFSLWAFFSRFELGALRIGIEPTLYVFGDTITARVVGTTGLSANFVGAFLLFPALISYARAARAESMRDLVAWLLAASLATGAMVVTLTRASIIALAVGFIVLLISGLPRRRSVALLAALVLVPSVIAAPLLERAMSVGTNRLALAREAGEFILDNPAFGLGPGQYPTTLPFEHGPELVDLSSTGQPAALYLSGSANARLEWRPSSAGDLAMTVEGRASSWDQTATMVSISTTETTAWGLDIASNDLILWSQSEAGDTRLEVGPATAISSADGLFSFTMTASAGDRLSVELENESGEVIGRLDTSLAPTPQGRLPTISVGARPGSAAGFSGLLTRIAAEVSGDTAEWQAGKSSAGFRLVLPEEDGTSGIIDRNAWSFPVDAERRIDFPEWPGAAGNADTSSEVAVSYASRTVGEFAVVWSGGHRTESAMLMVATANGDGQPVPVILIRDPEGPAMTVSPPQPTGEDWLVAHGWWDATEKSLGLTVNGFEVARRNAPQISGPIVPEREAYLGARRAEERVFFDGFVQWMALFDESLTPGQRQELGSWQGQASSEPVWLRSTAVLYVNAEDPATIAAYEQGVVQNLSTRVDRWPAGEIVSDRIVATPHNSYLLIAAEGGIVSGLLLLTASVLPLFVALRRGRESWVMVAGLGAASLAFIVQSLSNNLFQIPTVAAYFWVASAALLGEPDTADGGPDRPPVTPAAFDDGEQAGH